MGFELLQISVYNLKNPNYWGVTLLKDVCMCISLVRRFGQKRLLNVNINAKCVLGNVVKFD